MNGGDVLKDYLMGLIIFSIVGYFGANIYGTFAFAVIYSLIAIVYKLDKIEKKLNETNNIDK